MNQNPNYWIFLTTVKININLKKKKIFLRGYEIQECGYHKLENYARFY